jgi:hypothetical protein
MLVCVGWISNSVYICCICLNKIILGFGLPVPCAIFRSGCLLPFPIYLSCKVCACRILPSRDVIYAVSSTIQLLIFWLPARFSMGPAGEPYPDSSPASSPTVCSANLFTLCASISSQCRRQKWVLYVIYAPFERTALCLGTLRTVFPRSYLELGVLPWKRAVLMNCLQVKQSSICTLKFWTSVHGNMDCESGSHSEPMCPGCV